MTIQASQIDFEYPVVCFTKDGEIWFLQTPHQRMTCGYNTLSKNLQIGMDMVDASGRSWRVTDVRKIGYEAFRLRHIFSSLYPRLLVIDQTLEVLPSPGFEAVKARVCQHMDAFPGDYCEFSDDRAALEARKADVWATTNLAELDEVLGVDAFHD